MSRFTVARGVRADLRSIWRYVAIENHNPDAADRLIDRITDAIVMLARKPLLGQSREDLAPRVRSFVVSPYLVLYTPERYGLRVLQVVHAAREIHTAFRRDRTR